MKNCELCISPARIYCDSDQASLCWDCDSKIHGANFLVTRHSRTLLCHVCQSPTPWSASGAKLAPTVSVCEACVVAGYKPDNAGSLFHEGGGGSSEDEIRGGEELEIGSEEEDGDDSDYDEDEGGNQVVPWSPPPAITSLNSEESSNEDRDAPFPILLDRAPEAGSMGVATADISHGSDAYVERRLNLRRMDPAPAILPVYDRTGSIIQRISRLPLREVGAGGNAGAAIITFCGLSKDLDDGSRLS